MQRLFGTDGIRGIVNDGLDGDIAFRVGKAAAAVLTGITHHKAVIYIGKDTRASSDMLEAALAAGVTSAGADAVLLGIAPTPMVASMTVGNADAGIVISASHNPFEYNGIKIFNRDGYKLSDAIEDEIEEKMKTEIPLKKGAEIGRVRHDAEAVTRYADMLAGLVVGDDFSHLKVVIDCAHGAASATAELLFSRFGFANCEIINCTPDGTNINSNCGSTALGQLQKKVIEGGFDIGIAFDGDADRCLIVDEKGGILDGDRIMAICGLEEKRAGFLPHDTIVATVMSNLGFHVWAKQNGIKLITASVGDRYVLEEMQKGSYLLGGEQSGHLIFLRHSTTGDGQLTCLKLLSLLSRSSEPLSVLASGIPQYPQVLINQPIKPEMKNVYITHPRIAQAVAEAEAALGDNGRVLVRPSGTEALMRVMIEGKDKAEIESLAKGIINTIISVETCS